MVRVASIRSRPLADAQAQMSFLETRHLPDGRTFRSLVPLPLIRDTNPMLGTVLDDRPSDGRGQPRC